MPDEPHQFRRSSRDQIPNPNFQQRPPNVREPRSPPPESSTPVPPIAQASNKERAYMVDGPVEAFALTADVQFWDTFTDLRTIGKGHFAKVKQIRHNQTGEHFAVKVLDKTLADNDIEDLVREFQMLRALRHPNVIRLYAAYETPRKLYLVTELATGGELMKRLGDDASSVYSEDAVRKHMLTITSAVSYMHSKNCAHRDLKPENVLLSDGTEDAEIKIVDLGLSRFFDSSSPMRTICGTHKYLAPELIECDRGLKNGYDKAVDMWGVGLLAYIMLFGSNPFARDNQRATHNAILKCGWTFPSDYTVSQLGKDFISKLLRPKPEERMTADQALRAQWFSPDVPSSPGALLTDDPRRSVKEKLWEFNAERMLGNVVKGVHRRLGGAPAAS